MRLLIVEDDHRIGSALKKGLEQESFAVDLVFDGTNGLDLALSESYDVIVLDRMLPGMDGVSIAKELRKENNHIPILLLTAKSQIHERVEGLESGADDYLVKPFAFEELLARIRALSRRPKQSEQNILVVDDLTLDTNNFIVKRNGITIPLSNKEFSLLEYLMKKAGKTVTKEQIISHVWDYEADILPNTIEVFIGYLRKKIDKPFKKNIIKTVRGFGYTIDNTHV